MAGGGITGRNNFRKMYTANAKKSKYAAVLETPEMLREKELKAMGAEEAKAQPSKGKSMEVETSVSTGNRTSVAELTKMTENKLRVSKRKPAADVEMMPKIQLKSKVIAKK